MVTLSMAVVQVGTLSAGVGDDRHRTLALAHRVIGGVGGWGDVEGNQWYIYVSFFWLR